MTAASLWRGRALALVGIVLFALSVRTPVAGMSPLLERIAQDMTLGPLVLGIIGAVPPLAFVVSGLLTPALASRLGLERALYVALGLLALGQVGRALAPDATVLTIATIVATLGMGVGNVLLPPLVRRYFPDRVGLMTSLYATLIAVSSALPPLVAVPVADAAGWRTALGMWLVTTIAAAVPWVALLWRQRSAASAVLTMPDTVPPPPVEPGDAEAAATEAALEHPGEAPAERTASMGVRLLRSPTAWAIGVVFGISSMCAYAFFAWLPPLLVGHAGLDEASAGATLAIFTSMGLPAGVIVPLVVARFPRSTQLLTLVGAALLAIGYAGLLWAPSVATVVWAMSAGLGTLVFPLALVLINLRSATPATTVALSGFVQTVGYLMGAAGPFIVSLLHDATGGWTAPLGVLFAGVVLMVPAAIILHRGRLVDDEV